MTDTEGSTPVSTWRASEVGEGAGSAPIPFLSDGAVSSSCAQLGFASLSSASPPCIQLFVSHTLSILTLPRQPCTAAQDLLMRLVLSYQAVVFLWISGAYGDMN